MIPDDSRFETDPDELIDELEGLPADWEVGTPDPESAEDVARLTLLLRAHESRGRGWAGAGVEDVLVEVSELGLRTRENVVVRDQTGKIRAWGSVHDRAGGRMLFMHVVERDLPEGAGRACSDVLIEWAVGQARAVGSARGLAVQQIDSGTFAADERQQRWLAACGFERVRTWWQMSRPVTPDEAALVDDPAYWESDRATFRLVRRAGDGMPEETDLREAHDVIEGAFVDHFNHWEETFEEFVHRLREDPGHRWDHWWLAEIDAQPGADSGAEPDGESGAESDAEGAKVPVGALIATVSDGADGPDGSYVSYLGVLASARGRGVAKGLLHTVIADAAARGRDRVALEVDADSPTGATDLYTSMGWVTSYVTESWHRDVPIDD